MQKAGSPGLPGSDLVLLFNLDDDPSARNDVSTDHPEAVQRLQTMLADWAAELSPPPWPPVMNIRFDIWNQPFWFEI